MEKAEMKKAIALIEKVAAAATFGKVAPADCQAVVAALQAGPDSWDLWNAWIGVQNAAEAGDLRTVARAMSAVYWKAK